MEVTSVIYTSIHISSPPPSGRHNLMNNQSVFFAPSPVYTFRLLEIKYRDNGRYPLDVLTAILTPRLIKKRYTYPALNKKSGKPPLPQPIFNAIIKVAQIRLKHTNMTMEEFRSKLRQKFSSIKYKKKVQFIYTCLTYIDLALNMRLFF